MHMIRGTLAPAAILLLALACRGGDIDVTDSANGAQLPPPAAALSRGDGGVGLRDRLDRLEAELTAVLDGGLDEEAQASLMRAEATTDRLLEDEPDYAWLGSGYLVEARLRQIQALADRIVAEFRRGVAAELVLEDVAALRLSVTELRSRLQEPGNGAPPPPLDSLLAGHADDAPLARSTGSPAASDTTTAAEPAPAPRRSPEGLLGEPIQP
ncbi:MAG TPA: hypothetical protein VMN78_01085 [Longimicrobiales bacterium]|nr:hypothetical protein [Longimicrobiales bacterium]